MPDLCAISQPFRRFQLGFRQKSEIESRHHLPTKSFCVCDVVNLSVVLFLSWEFPVFVTLNNPYIYKTVLTSTLIDNMRMGEHGSAGGVEAQGNV